MAPPPPPPLLLAAALFLVVLLSPAPLATAVPADSPFVVAHKKATLTRLKSGAERVAVEIDLYNQGSVTAYDVSLTDDNWPQDTFELVLGTTSKTWERLDPGSSVSHSFVFETKVKQTFHGSPAVIKYRVPTKASPVEAYSTPILPLDILTDRPPEKKFELIKRLLAKYGSLVSVLSFVGLFIYVVASPSKSGAVKGGKKKR